MGSKISKEHKASSPLSSWGGSLDDLICGEGKICSERWTPINSREASPTVHIRRKSRSAPSIRRHSTRYDDYDMEIIRHQPVPMDSYSIRTAMEPLSFEPSYASDRRAYLPQLSDLTHRSGKRKKKRKRKPKEISSGAYPATPIQIFIDTRKVAEVDPRNRSRTFFVAENPSRPVANHTRMQSGKKRSSSEPRYRYSNLHKTPERQRMRSVPQKRVIHTRTFVTSTNTLPTMRSTRRVVPPRHLRPFEVPPPRPFKFHGVPDQPYHRIKTASHPFL